MEENKFKNENCDTCSADFQNEIHELVDNVEKHHSQADHDKTQHELDEAFKDSDKNTQK